MPHTDHFDGFPKTALRFFADLEKNNNRDWFNAHRDTFDNDVIAPAQAFIEALGNLLRSLHPAVTFDTRANGSGSLFRIYRDVRFSKDKSPYKTHAGILFWLGRNPKKTDNPGFYVGIDAKGAHVYAGMWQFPKKALEKFRDVVSDPDSGAQLAAILTDLEKKGYEIVEPRYKRVPRGFDQDHPNAALLRLDSVHAGCKSIAPDVVTSPDFVLTAFDHCQTMWPMVEWVHDRVA